MALKCSTFTTCSQLICPKHVIPFYIPQPLQLKKKHLAVTSPLLTPIILCLSFIFALPPIISLFQICNLLFIFLLCLVGRASVHLIKMYIYIFNHSSKESCLPREPEPCPVLQEITMRLSRTR